MPSSPEYRSIALIADTHGHLDPRVAELSLPCDLIIHAGDIGNGAILRTLAQHGAEVVAVAGNNDTPRHWPADDQAELADLPDTASVSLPGGTLVIDHGHRFAARDRHRRLRARYRDAAAVVCGHSHRPAADTAGLPWILNPGAAGRTRTYGGPACLLLEIGADGWVLHPHRFEPQSARAAS
ncbi:MAG: metallophosphoesterase family protein [Halofilum sp. (in: g-proteobacteria)]